MIIATWNVNSIRSRLERLLDWLAHAAPDVVCLQELKVTAGAFPFDALAKVGYEAAVCGQPTYNGVAILSRAPLAEVRPGLDDGVDDPQARLIAARVGDVDVLSAYVPNGGEVGTEKWTYKLAWIARLRACLAERYDPRRPLALCGDFNVAPDDLDVARPEAWSGSVLCHPDARAGLDDLGAWGLVDLVRHCQPAGGPFTWWDYRNRAYERDDGLRIDHILVTAPLLERATAVHVARAEREGEKPSDHAPVLAAFDEPARRGWLPAPRADAVRAPDEAGVAAGGGGTSVGPAAGTAAPGGEARARGRDRGPEAGAEAAAEAPASRQHLLLVDGHSVAYRAFYGLPLYDRSGRPSFSTTRGELTNAVYGFANTLIKTWNEQRPDYIAVAFDLGRTFRDDMYPEYKATRAKMPDELAPQIDRIVELVRAFGIPAVTAEGYEADDILGTLARRAAAEGLAVTILTGDSDAFQLIDPHVRVLAPGRLWTDVAAHDEAAVRERYGLPPAALIDYKALVGDSSDNVPGVRGVGEKTALPLIQTFGSVEGVYEHLGEIAPPRVRKALEAGREMALLSKRLVTIRTDVPLDLEWASCAVRVYDRGRVEALFDELEFRSIRDRLPPGGRGDPGTGDEAAAVRPAGGAAQVSAPGPASSGTARQMGLFAADWEADGGVNGEADGGADRPEDPSSTAATVVRDEAALDELVAALGGAERIAFDVETTSTDPLRAELVGIAFAVEPGAGWYVPVGHAGDEAQLARSRVLAAIKPVLEDPDRVKVGHNAKYDMAVLRRAGIHVRGLGFDTMLAEFVLEPGSRLGLKHLAKVRLGVAMTEISELIGRGKGQITMAEVPVSRVAPYAAADADMTLRLMADQLPRLERVGPAMSRLLAEVELPLVPVLLDMELTGVQLDVPFLAAMSERFAARLGEIEAQVHAQVGTTFNLSSPQQLATVLFDQLGLEAPGARTTRTGQESVAIDVLESMRGRHPVIDLVIEHRQLTKLKGTYLDALPRLVDPDTGRVHTSFNQTGAVSGRLSSQDPNLQNIPIRTELGREVRQAFVVPDGWRLISADYSQVELRIAAHLADDPGLKRAFAAGEDIHRATAATVLGIPPADVTADQRSFAKRVNFGLLYGMGARSLAQSAGIPMKEAQQFIDAYFAGFPSIQRYLAETRRRAREDGYVATVLGRRRYFPILAQQSRDNRTRVLQAAAEREAVNHPMQGSAADIIKLAMIRVHRALSDGGFKARLLLQVHDELVLEAPAEEVDRVVALVRSRMEDAYPLDPALKVDVGVGANWAEVK